jgi:hypothetical protein
MEGQVWKRTYLLELLDGTRVDTTALVDQVTGGGGLAGIDVADNDDVNVGALLLTVKEVSMGQGREVEASSVERRASEVRRTPCLRF